MGYLRRHAILVTDSGYGDFIVHAHAEASRIFKWVSEISPSATNCERSFFVPPDGSKEGWEESNAGDARRDDFIKFLRSLTYDDGSSPLVWCEVQYGDDDGKSMVLRADDKEVERRPNDISTPRPTDCADIREGRVTVLARDQKGEACMTMVKR